MLWAWIGFLRRSTGSCENGNNPSEITISRKLLKTCEFVRFLRRIQSHTTSLISKHGLTFGVTNDMRKCKRFGLVNATYIAPERQNRQSRVELKAILSEYETDKFKTKNFLFLLLEFDT